MNSNTKNHLSVLNEIGAVLTDDHFVYTSGRHGSAYVNKATLTTHPALADRFCQDLARMINHIDCEFIASPAVGGISFGAYTALHSGRRFVFAEKTSAGLAFKRGYDTLIKGKSVIVVDDILNTGQSLGQMIAAVEASGAIVAAAAVIVNRGGITSEMLGVPTLYSLVDVHMDSYEPSECPLCQRSVPFNMQLGHANTLK